MSLPQGESVTADTSKECDWCQLPGCADGKFSDPTDDCKECDALWHHYRTGDRNDLCELRHIHKQHARLAEAEALIRDLVSKGYYCPCECTACEALGARAEAFLSKPAEKERT